MRHGLTTCVKGSVEAADGLEAGDKHGRTMGALSTARDAPGQESGRPLAKWLPSFGRGGQAGRAPEA